MASTQSSAAWSKETTSRSACRSATRLLGCTCSNEGPVALDLHGTGELRIPGDELLRVLARQRLPELSLDHGRVRDGLRREVVVRVEIRLSHEAPCRVGRLTELLQLRRGIQIVVPILGALMAPPGGSVPAVQPHVVEALDIGEVVLPDRESELGLV